MDKARFHPVHILMVSVIPLGDFIFMHDQFNPMDSMVISVGLILQRTSYNRVVWTDGKNEYEDDILSPLFRRPQSPNEVIDLMTPELIGYLERNFPNLNYKLPGQEQFDYKLNVLLARA